MPQLVDRGSSFYYDASASGQERLVGKLEAPQAATAEAAIRFKMRCLIPKFNGLFGKVMTELIAEGQSDPLIVQELYEQHISHRRAATIADVERGKAAGEFAADTAPELLIDSIIGPIYYRLLLRLRTSDGAVRR
jgi:tetracycline repressor-like protein